MSSLGERIKAALSRGRSGGAVSAGDEPHREDVVLALHGDVPSGPSLAVVERGRRTLLSQLSEVHSGGIQKMPFANFALSPIAAAVAGSVLLLGSFAGVSAAAGGPDVTGPVRHAVGVGDDDGDDDIDDGNVDDVDDGDETGDDNSPPSPGTTPDGDDDDGDDSSDDDSPPSPGATPDDDETDDQDDSADDGSPPSPGATPDDGEDSPDDDSPSSPKPTSTPEVEDESSDDGDGSGPG